MSDRPVLWIVVPCYGEEAVLPLTAPQFRAELGELVASGRVSDASRICFVDDGSTDATWRTICDLAAGDEHFVGISLSRNRGHQNALLCGLMEARAHCDLSISIDCDGQDDITAMTRMVDAYLDGADVVYGVRNDRTSDSAFKRMSAEAYYRLLSSMGVESVFNHADYRLMSRRALDALAQFREVNLYLRGMVPQLGFPTATVEYARAERQAGESHYPLRKMLALAFDGITSLSVKPIRMVSGLGVGMSLLSIVGLVWALVSTLTGHAVSGWASLICVVFLVGGMQLLCLGVLGEYVGKLYLEVKARPRYIVAERTWDEL